MRLIINILIFLIFAKFSYGQKISKSTQKIVKNLEKINQVQCARIGFTGSTSSQYATYKKLCKLATSKELITLTDYTNETVRCYAFQCLADKGNANLFPILLKHLSDNKSVTTFCGCIESSTLVGDYFVQIATPKLNSKQKEILDSIIIFKNGINLNSKQELLSKILPTPKYHNRIRQIAKNEKNEIAALALARYKDPNDINIIKQFFNKEKTEYYAIYAAKEFPNSSFYPLLEKIFIREWKKENYDYPKWRILYQALAKYPNKKTFEFFKLTTETKDSFRYQTLCTYLKIALRKYPNKIYEPLKKKIILDNYHQKEVEQEMKYEN